MDDVKLDSHQGEYVGPEARFVARWPELGGCPLAARWLALQADLGRSPRAIDAYGLCRSRLATGSSTQRYIHLSGRDLAQRLERGMTQIHAQRMAPIRGALP